MPVMQGTYPPRKQGENVTEVLFEHPPEPHESNDDLEVLPPSSIQVRHINVNSDALPFFPSNPYNIEHYLITCTEEFSPFEQNLGEPPFRDLRGEPVWPALATVPDGGIHPGKAVPHLNPPIRVPLGGTEYHLPPKSPYSILLANPSYMEYTRLDHNDKIPEGYDPVPAGCEADGQRKLYFASAKVPKTFFDGLFGNRGDEGMIEVPGKWGEHLGGVMVAYDEKETVVKQGGKVLCWKRKA